MDGVCRPTPLCEQRLSAAWLHQRMQRHAVLGRRFPERVLTRLLAEIRWVVGVRPCGI